MVPIQDGTERAMPSHGREICLLERHERLSYAEALDLQRKPHADRVADPGLPGVLIVLEHDPVITIGRMGSRSEVFAPEDIEVVETDRGGAATFHGPGQLVLYPVLPLVRFRKDLGWYLRSIEEVALRALVRFGLSGTRVPGRSGVWAGREKIAALGVAVRRWITYHGLSFNYAVDLTRYDHFVPCGIRDAGVTSLDRLLGRPVARSEAEPVLLAAFEEVFGVQLVPFEATVAAGGDP
jgi:lipoyl(octanoyl) transferase